MKNAKRSQKYKNSTSCKHSFNKNTVQDQARHKAIRKEQTPSYTTTLLFAFWGISFW